MRRAALAGLAIACGAFAWWAARGEHGESDGVEAPSPAAEARQFDWPAGTTLVYALEVESDARVVPFVAEQAAAPISSTLTLTAEVEIKSHGPAPGGTLLEWTVRSCESARLDAGGQRLLDGCELADQPLLAVVDATGRVERIEQPETTGEIPGYLLQFLITETAVTLGPGSAWSAVEQTLAGRAESDYRAVGDAIERRRERYADLSGIGAADEMEQAVDARHQIVVEGGQLVRLRGSETIRAALDGTDVMERALHIEMTRVDAGRHEGAPPAKRVARGPAAAVVDGATRRRLLENRAGDLTEESVMALLKAHADSGRFPNHSKTLWQLTAFLELHPALCAEVGALAADGARTHAGRALLMDVLSSVRHPAAQAAMRAALEAEPVRTDPRHAHLFQRLGFVEAPTPETVEYVADRFEGSTDLNDRMSAAFTLGSVIDHVGPGPVADAHNSRLQAALAAAPVGEQQGWFIQALGNAERADNAPVVAGYADADAPGTRIAVARAVDDPPTAEGDATLRKLVADVDPRVQRQAIRSMKGYGPDASHLAELTELARSGRLHPQNVRFVLELTKHTRHEMPEALAPLLDALLPLNPRDNRAQAAIRRLRASL